MRRLRGASEPPADTWVMVEVLESLGPFADPATAMQVALKWADYLGLDHLYVKERRSRRLIGHTGRNNPNSPDRRLSGSRGRNDPEELQVSNAAG